MRNKIILITLVLTIGLFALYRGNRIVNANNEGCIGEKFIQYTGDIYESIKVTRVIDGDTLELENGEKVSLIGIDCPEMDTEGGEEAYELTRGLVEGKEVSLEFDVEKYDKFGKLFAYVYVLSLRWDAEKEQYIYHILNSQESMLNEAILRMGYASPMTIPPNVRYAETFKELYQEARENMKGLWTTQTTERK